MFTKSASGPTVRMLVSTYSTRSSLGAHSTGLVASPMGATIPCLHTNSGSVCEDKLGWIQENWTWINQVGIDSPFILI